MPGQSGPVDMLCQCRASGTHWTRPLVTLTYVPDVCTHRRVQLADFVLVVHCEVWMVFLSAGYNPRSSLSLIHSRLLPALCRRLFCHVPIVYNTSWQGALKY